MNANDSFITYNEKLLLFPARYGIILSRGWDMSQQSAKYPKWRNNNGT